MRSVLPLSPPLQFFHRGDHLCPTMIQFQSGINKARDAIGRSIGNPATVKLNLKGDLSHFKIFKERTPRLSRSAVPRRPSTVQLESIKPVANEKTLDKLLQVRVVSQIRVRFFHDHTIITSSRPPTGSTIMMCQGYDNNSVIWIVQTRRVPVQRVVERDEIPYPYKVHDTTLHSRA